MKKNLKISLYILSIILILLSIVLILLSTLDTNLIISNLIKSLENELFLKIEYKYEGKSIIQVVRGIELKDVEIFDNTGKSKILLLSLEEFRAQFDIINLLFSRNLAFYLYCKNVRIQTDRINNYLNSPKVKNKFLPSNETQEPQEIPIKTLTFENLIINLNGKELRIDAKIQDLSNPKIWGYIHETKTKFSFSERSLIADRIVWNDNIELKNIRLSLNEDYSEGKGKVEGISYENILARNVNFNINISKNLKSSGEITEISIQEQNITLSNIAFSVKPDEKELKIIAISNKIKIVASLDAQPKINVTIDNLTYNNLPQGLIKFISNVAKEVIIDGNLIISTEPNFSLNGKISILAETTLKNTLFFKIPILGEFKDREIKLSSSLNDGKTDIKVVLNADMEFKNDLSISLKKIELYSKDLYISSLLTPIAVNNSRTMDNSSNEIVKIRNTPFYINLDNLYLQGKTPEFQNVEVKGTLNNGDKTTIVATYSVSGFLFREVEINGSGEISLGEKIHGILKILPAKANLGKVYKNISLFDLGGEAHGNINISELQAEISEGIIIKGKVNVDKIELINMKVQNEITRLLNMDLSHIFIDSGEIDFVISENNIIANGNLNGDIETEFHSQLHYPPKNSEIEFKYLKVDKSIIENVPKIFFLANEINGIKFKTDNKYITFDKFTVRF